jgi:hypothetical protein
LIQARNLVCPARDLGVLGLGAERERGLAGGVGGLPVAGVVFHAGQQQRNPPGQHQDLPVLPQCQPLALELSDPAQPGLPFGQELIGRQEWVLRAQPVRHHPQATQRGVIKIRTLQPADQLQRVHACDRQYIGVGVAPGRHREDRVCDGPECPGDDRLVELTRLDLARLPAFPLPQQTRIVGVDLLVAGGVRLQRPHCLGLAPVARLTLVRHAARPRGPVLGHRRSLPARSALLRVSQIQGG